MSRFKNVTVNFPPDLESQRTYFFIGWQQIYLVPGQTHFQTTNDWLGAREWLLIWINKWAQFKLFKLFVQQNTFMHDSTQEANKFSATPFLFPQALHAAPSGSSSTCGPSIFLWYMYILSSPLPFPLLSQCYQPPTQSPHCSALPNKVPNMPWL